MAGLDRGLRIRISSEDFDAAHRYARRHGTDVSKIVRDYLRRLSDADTDGERQGLMPGANIIALATATERACVGRHSDPGHNCHNVAHEDYDQCRGCFIADSRSGQWTKPKRAARQGRTRSLKDL